MLDHCDETYHSLKYCIGVLSWLLYQIIAIKTKQLCYSNNFALQAKHCPFLTIVNSWIQVYLCAKNITTIVFGSSQLFGKDPCLSILTSSSINVSLCTLSSAIRDLRKLTQKKLGKLAKKGVKNNVNCTFVYFVRRSRHNNQMLRGQNITFRRKGWQTNLQYKCVGHFFL